MALNGRSPKLWEPCFSASAFGRSEPNYPSETSGPPAERTKSPHRPRPVSSPLDPCCHLHERPVVLLRDSMKFFVHAAFLSPRAHAAQKHNDRVGLNPAIPQRVQRPQHLSPKRKRPHLTAGPCHFFSDRLDQFFSLSTILPAEIHGIMPRSLAPVSSIRCSSLARRDAFRVG